MGLDNLDQNYYDKNGKGDNHPWGHRKNYKAWKIEKVEKISETIENHRKNMFEICNIYGQVYLFPFIKLTHDKTLNGNLEFIIGWFNKCLIIKI